MKLIIGFNQVLNRKLREVMYSVINDFIEKDEAKALFLENVTFVAEIGDTKQLTVHWNKDQAIIASAPPLGVNQQLFSALQLFIDTVEEPPEANCSCHIAPPCGDCVNYSQLREAFEEGRAAIAAAEASKGGGL